MLHFKLDLVSPLFMNVQAYLLMFQSCKMQNLDYLQSYVKLRALFPDMNEMQYYEVDYEYTELRCVQCARPRIEFKEYYGNNSRFIRQLLKERNEEGFSVPERFIQSWGRGIRMKDIKQAINRTKRDGDKYLPRNNDHE